MDHHAIQRRTTVRALRHESNLLKSAISKPLIDDHFAGFFTAHKDILRVAQPLHRQKVFFQFTYMKVFPRLNYGLASCAIDLYNIFSPLPDDDHAFHLSNEQGDRLGGEEVFFICR